MFFNQGFTLKRIIHFSFLIIIFPICAFQIDPIIEEGNSAYREKRYQDAYCHFSWYLFQYGINSAPEDYYIALIGKKNCMKYLDPKETSEVEDYFFCNLMDADLTEEQNQLLSRILQNSVYWDND